MESLGITSKFYSEGTVVVVYNTMIDLKRHHDVFHVTYCFIVTFATFVFIRHYFFVLIVC